MTIRYKCEECGSVLNIKDEKAGTQGKCPKCKTEFLIPPPEGDQPDADDDELAISGDSESAGPDSSQELAATAVQKKADDFDDDDIEKILDSEEKPKRSVKDSYGVAAGDEDDDDDDSDDSPDEDDEPLALKARRRKPVDFDDDDDEEDEEEERPRKKAGKGKPSREPASTSAGLAKSLMARGDKGTKSGKDDRRSKRPFGAGGEHEGDEGEEGFSLKEKASYLARFGVPAVVALVLAIGFYVWYMRGWQRGDLPELASVTGVVTLDGAPLPKAEIQFIPQQQDPNKPNLRLSSSQAITDDKGEFVLGYNLYAQGAVLGKHRVQIICYSKEGLQIIPSQYNVRSELYREVKPGSNRENFELKSSEENPSSSVGGFNPNP